MKLFNELKFVNVDYIHYNYSNIMSLEKTYNYIISPREPGKTSGFLRMLYKQWYNNDKTFVCLKRLQISITDVMIEDMSKTINKFLKPEEQIKFIYRKGNMKDGICDVYCYPANQDISYFNTDENHLFFRIVAMNIPSDRFKGQVMNNLYYMFMDEFIVNPTWGEKYLAGEWNKFREIYNTFIRSCPTRNLRCIFCGNPYSIYNPYFDALDVHLKDINIGNMYTGKNWAIEFVKLTDELRNYILSTNPLYEFDDSYSRYAIDGACINDENIKIVELQPKMFRLIYCFKYDNKILGIYKNCNNNIDEDVDDYYWIGELKDTVRTVTCFNPSNMSSNIRLYSNKLKKKFERLVNAFRNYMVSYQDLGCYYTFLEIYEIIS